MLGKNAVGEFEMFDIFSLEIRRPRHCLHISEGAEPLEIFQKTGQETILVGHNEYKVTDFGWS